MKTTGQYHTIDGRPDTFPRSNARHLHTTILPPLVTTTREQTPATTPPSSPETTPPFQFYSGTDFSIDYPTGWVVSHIPEIGGNIDSTFQPPAAGGVLVRVDENPVDNESLAASAAPEIAALEKDPTYTPLGFTRVTSTGCRAFGGNSKTPRR